MRSTRMKLLALLAIMAMLAAACGGSDDAASDGTSDATDTAADDGSTDDGSTDDGSADDGAADDSSTNSGLEGTLRVLIHQNPPGVEFMENFNSEFEAANPGVSIDMTVVNADDIPTVNQTRLNAKDIDVTTISVTGFANAVQPYMTGADSPYWQQLIEAGLLMDLSGQPYLANYDQAAIDGSSFDGGVYALSLGRTSYSGMFVNEDILAEVGVDIPTTWDELVSACEAVKDAGFKCAVAGGQDAWPVFVGTYGLLGSLYPDQQALVEGLWDGSVKWDDEQGIKLFERYDYYANDMLDAESAGLTGDSAAQRYAAGDVAFGPMGAWNAGAVADNAGFEWEYIPFPGSDDAADNQTLFGKDDMSFAVAADTPVPDIAHAYLAAFSEPDNYNAFANATNYLPTQPTAALESALGTSIAPILQAGNFAIGFEQLFVQPKGAGQWHNAKDGALWMYNGDFTDPAVAAEQAQADLEAGLAG
ncbi:MAG: extracellular solute-binding protein [Acidimicrobiales bacterium]|nr:extracellular solute-binding protein [Acidimicrobiales bacterium]